MREDVEAHDKRVKERADFMFDYLDFDNDRVRIRNKFIREMNKRTTLEDIGRVLDKFIIDEQADSYEYLDFRDIKKVEDLKTLAHKDTSSLGLSWIGRQMADSDPLKPMLFEDSKDLFEDTIAGQMQGYKDIVDKIKFEDERTDYTVLTPDQKSEIALFHSMKQDPYYKHQLYNVIRI